MNKVHVPSRSSHFFESRRVKSRSELLSGLHIRVFFQPLFQNPLSFDVYTFEGKPFKARGHSKEQHWFAKMPGPAQFPYDNVNKFYVESLGLRPLDLSHRYVQTQTFLFSNKLLSELKRIHALGAHAQFCFWMNTQMSEHTLQVWTYLKEEAMEEERMWDSLLDSSFDDYPDMHDDGDYGNPQHDTFDDGGPVTYDTLVADDIASQSSFRDPSLDGKPLNPALYVVPERDPTKTVVKRVRRVSAVQPTDKA